MFDTLSQWKRRILPSSSQSNNFSGSQTTLLPSHQHQSYVESGGHSGQGSGLGTGRGSSTGGSRQFLSISQPIPRSSPSSLSGSISFVRSTSGSGGAGAGAGVGEGGSGGSVIYAAGGGNVGDEAVWEDQILPDIEDNRPMGSFGRRSKEFGMMSRGYMEGDGEEEEGPDVQGAHAPETSSLSAPAVVRLDSVPPRHRSYEQEQQDPQIQGYHQPHPQQPQYQPQSQQFHYPTPRGNLRLQTDVNPHPPNPSYSTHHRNASFMQPPPMTHHAPPHRQPIPGVFLPRQQVKQLSPIAEASPTSTVSASDYPSLKKVGSEILAGSSISSSSPNLRNSTATGASGRRRSGSVGSAVISAGTGESQSAGTGSASAGTGTSTVGSLAKQSGAGKGVGNGMFGSLGIGSGGGNGGGLSPATPCTAGSSTNFHHADAGSPLSPLSQYATPTTASASPGGPGLSPNIAIPSPLSAVGYGGNQNTGSGGGGSGGVGTIVAGCRSGTPEVTRPPPAYASPFISRTLNRTASQTSSRGRSSSTSTTNTSTITTVIPAMGGTAGTPAGVVLVAPDLGRQGTFRSVTTSTPRQEYQQQHTHSRSESPTVVGSSSGGGVNPLSSSTTLVTSSTPAGPVPTIPPLNLTPPFPGPHPTVGPRPGKGGNGNGNGNGGRARVLSGSSWISWGSRGKSNKGVRVMPKIPGSYEGHYDEYDESEGEYTEEDGEGEYTDDEEGVHNTEDRYEEGTSAPGEEASEGYDYGYGYGYGDGHSVGEEGFLDEVKEQERMNHGERVTVRYADDAVRDQHANDILEPGPSGIRIRVEEYIDPPDHQTGVNGPRARPTGPRAQATRIPSSESFITRRWSRDRRRGFPTDSHGMRDSIHNFFLLRAKNQHRWFGLANFTPAFWAFWLGFVCPFLWLVGGWHFTNFGEQPPKMGVWEFYFSGSSPNGGWKEVFCCCLPGRRRRPVDVESGEKGVKDDIKRKGKQVHNNTIPRWISEKQSSDDGRARLNDPNLKRSLRGISFGYPFIPRPPIPPPVATTVRVRLIARMLRILRKPNRVLDQLYGVRLREVRGRPESGRRMFDPWVQRCRYVFCYACALMAIGLCTASVCLLVFNTRQLR